MRCKTCKAKAVIELRRHNAAFCRDHFFEYFDRQVERNIRRHGMLGAHERVLIAVSGGKDSLALWDVLSRMGYRTVGLHIHLGIGAYSDRSRAASVAFAAEHGLDLIQVDLARQYGLGVTELSDALHRPACSGCGQSKRYMFNRAAREHGFPVLATGHNLDDEAATLLANLLGWQTEYLGRQSPILESTGAGFVRKIKPLYTLTEQETALYCFLRRIDYVEEECPNALGAKSLLYKDILNRLEHEMPGTKMRFFAGFLERARAKLDQERAPFVACTRCGEPSPSEVCGFCRMWERALERAARPRQRRTGS